MTAKQHLQQVVATLHRYLLGRDPGDAQRAYQLAKAGTAECPAHVWLYLIHIWLVSETGRTTVAEGLLHSFKSALASYANSPDVTAFYHFLVGLCAADTDPKALKKSEDTLLALGASSEREHAYAHLLAYLYKDHDPVKSYHYAEHSFAEGCRSPLVYCCLAKSFMSGRRYYRPELMLAFLRWAHTHGVLNADLLEINREMVQSIVKEDVALFSAIYDQCELAWLLQELATCLATTEDTSPLAYQVYKKLEQKQLFDERVNCMLMRAAYANAVPTVSKFAMLSFIKSDLEHIGDISIEETPLDPVLPYVCHLLLTLPTMAGMIKRHNLEGLLYQVSLACATQVSPARDQLYHNSLFVYALAEPQLATTHPDLHQHMLFQLFEDFFAYQLTFTDPCIAQVMVSEAQKKTPLTYDVWDMVGEITAISNTFQLLSFDVDKKIRLAKPTMEKLVNGGDIHLCEAFYRNKLVSPDLLLYMALYYVDNQQSTPLSLEILARAVKLKDLANDTKLRLNLALGDMLASQDKAQALDYYREVSIDQVSAEHVPHMFEVFLTGKEYYLALEVISHWQTAIPEPLLHKGISDIVDNYLIGSSRRQSALQIVAQPIYALLIQGYEHPEFLPIVLNCYQGNVSELAELSCALHARSVTYLALDQHVLGEAIRSQSMSAEAQQVFVRYYHRMPDDKLASDFIYYICYHLMTMGAAHCVGQQLVSVIETLAMAGDSPNYLLYLSLCMALDHVSEINREIILQETLTYLDEIDVFFPAFMGLDTPHLSPKQATLFAVTYRARAGQDVYLVLQIDGGEHRRIPMDYFRFGMYLASFPLFYNEQISYYFEDETAVSATYQLTQADITLKKDSPHPFFAINNAILYKELFKHAELEKTLERLYKTPDYINFDTLI